MSLALRARLSNAGYGQFTRLTQKQYNFRANKASKRVFYILVFFVLFSAKRQKQRFFRKSEETTQWLLISLLVLFSLSLRPTSLVPLCK